MSTATESQVLTTVNEPLVRATIDWIEAHPRSWDQTSWMRHVPFLGFRACFGGHALRLARVIRTRNYGAFGTVKWLDTRWHRWFYGEPQVAWGDAASATLGLTESQAGWILGFTSVGGFRLSHARRHPTVAELKDRISAVTGITFEETR